MIKKAFQANSKIVSNTKSGAGYFKIVLRFSRMPVMPEPGQFVEVKVADSRDPLLRRPFSVHRMRGFNMEILYEVLGKGTQALSQKKPGEYLDVIGPLGNGFTYPKADSRKPIAILVAGGMGVAPLIFLAEKLREIPNPKTQTPNLILLGARKKSQILCEDEFKKLGCEVKIATDDGSRGFKGTATDLLKKELLTHNSKLLTIYGCGPHPMLKELSGIAKQHSIPAQVSLEAHMACGIGACMGCVVKQRTNNQKLGTHFEYKRVCKDGPVFNADEIIW